MVDSSANEIIAAVAAGGGLSDAELNIVLRHIAAVGFDESALEVARGTLAGVSWGGRPLRGRDRVRPSVRHFLRHVLQRREWPPDTDLSSYLESVHRVVLDPTSGLFMNRYRGAPSLAIVRESRELRGPRGGAWVLVQYRLSIEHWVTAFQPRNGLDELNAPEWGDIRWLRRPVTTPGLNSI